MKTFKHVTIEIEQDDSAGNPRDEFDNLSRFLCPSSSHYITGGKTDLEFHPDQDGGENLRNLRREKALIVEFYNPNVGTCYAYVTRQQLQKEYLDFGYSTRKAFYHARRCIQGEINDWLAFCNGEVYGYIIKDEDGETLDSCWGYYGRQYAEEEAQPQAEYWEAEKEKEEQHMNERLAHACGLPEPL